jgi:recombination protein RecA
VKDKAGNVIGIHTTVTIKKNKVAAPFRKCEFDIIFGKGIVEDEYIFDEVRSHCKENKGVIRDNLKINISGDGAWKELVVNDEKTGEVIVEKKFYKAEFGNVMRDEKYRKYVLMAIDSALTIHAGEQADNNEEEVLTDE